MKPHPLSTHRLISAIGTALILLSACNETSRPPATVDGTSTSNIRSGSGTPSADSPAPRTPDWRPIDRGTKRLPVPFPADKGRNRSLFTWKFNRAVAEFRKRWIAAPITTVVLDQRTNATERLAPATRQETPAYRVDHATLRTLVIRRTETAGPRGIPDFSAARTVLLAEVEALRRSATDVLDLVSNAGNDSLSVPNLLEGRRIRALDLVLERVGTEILGLRDPGATARATKRPSVRNLPPTRRPVAPRVLPIARVPIAEAPLPLTPILATRIGELRWDLVFVNENLATGARRSESFAWLSTDEANAFRDRRAFVSVNVDAIAPLLAAGFTRARMKNPSASIAECEALVRNSVLRTLANIDRAMVEQRKAIDRLAQTLRDDRLEGERVRIDLAREGIASRKIQDLVAAWRSSVR